MKLSINLPESDFADLRAIAKDRQITLTEALRRAIRMELWLEENVIRKPGAELLFEHADGTRTQVVLLR